MHIEIAPKPQPGDKYPSFPLEKKRLPFPKYIPQLLHAKVLFRELLIDRQTAKN
jgi:hypothetical protein